MFIEQGPRWGHALRRGQEGHVMFAMIGCVQFVQDTSPSCRRSHRSITRFYKHDPPGGGR